MKIKVMTVFGTRPEAIKMAPLVKEIEKNENMQSIVCVTGQHKEMLYQVLDIFNIKPDYDLSVMRQNQTITTITTDILNAIEDVIKKENPNMILVHGDTSSTLAGALGAFYNQVSIGHVEAGLRTYDKYSPFPEEMNRQLTSRLADIHFCPTISNKENLIKENINKNLFITGNTVIDALKTTVNKNYKFKDENLAKIDFSAGRYILLTAHRRENLGKGIENICNAVKTLANTFDDIHFIYPVHLNPKVRQTVFNILDGVKRVHLIDPIDVCDMHNLMDRCYFVMTDSGGLQEEAPALSKPVLVLRKETERPEAVEFGTVRLVGVDKDEIINCATKLLTDENEYNKMAKAANPYGDGFASERSVKAILSYFDMGEKPNDFIAK